MLRLQKISQALQTENGAGEGEPFHLQGYKNTEEVKSIDLDKNQRIIRGGTFPHAWQQAVHFKNYNTLTKQALLSLNQKRRVAKPTQAS